MTVSNAAHAPFVNALPDLKRIAAYHFRHLDADRAQEAVQNTVSLAWKFYRRVWELGRQDEPNILKGVIKFAIRQTKSGRMIQGTHHKKAKDVLRYRDLGKVQFESSGALEGLVSKHDTSIPEIVSFRIDVPAFMATLKPRQQQIAEDMVYGLTTSEVAEKHKVTPSAISQFRTRFKKMYDEFFAA